MLNNAYFFLGLPITEPGDIKQVDYENVLAFSHSILTLVMSFIWNL